MRQARSDKAENGNALRGEEGRRGLAWTVEAGNRLVGHGVARRGRKGESRQASHGDDGTGMQRLDMAGMDSTAMATWDTAWQGPAWRGSAGMNKENRWNE